MKQVVILAGGKGTRLSERLGNLPKPLIDVCGKPLLEWQILLAKRYGFSNVIILVNFRSEKIVEFCLSNNNWGLDIKCLEDGEPLGTAGSVLQILHYLESEFLVMYGDTMLDVDLHQFYLHHSKAGKSIAASLLLHPNDHPQDSDLVEIDSNNKIIGFHSYPHDNSRYYPNLVNAALYWINRESLEPLRCHKGAIDFAKELFPIMLNNGMTLLGYKSSEYIKDCGTPARIDKVRADFKAGRIKRSGLRYLQRAIFIDRDGTLNKEVGYISDPNQFQLISGTENAIRKLNENEYRVCVVTNQPVVARGECSDNTLRLIHNKLETLLGKHRAFIDRIYYCPHHPDRGFDGEVLNLKVKCTCRKPQTGMIEKAILDLNIERNESWLIGDTSVDILTAKRAGIRSILVETGYAGLDHNHLVTPDYVLPDLPSAVDFIIDYHPRLMSELTPIALEITQGSIVLVGGQSRSGKSFFASALVERLSQMGKNSKVVSTDFWLRSQDQRAAGVMGRHDMEALHDFVNSISNLQRPFSINIPAYKKKYREQIQNANVLYIDKEDIVIFEGVIALGLQSVIQSINSKFFVQTDESIRRLRIINEYLLRGIDEKTANEIYQKRLIDEFELVSSLGSDAIKIQFENFTLMGFSQ